MGVTLETVKLLWPECVLLLAAAWMLVAGTLPVAQPGQRRWFWGVFTIAALIASAFALFYGQWWTLWSGGEASWGHSGPLAIDYFGFSLRLVALGAGVILTLMLWRSLGEDLAPEHLGMLLFAVLGVMLTASADEMALLFLGLELVSIPTYVALFMAGRTRGSLEATMKYFFLSVFSSAVLLYGLSFLYGLVGTTWLPEARERLVEGDFPLGWAPVATALILAGLGFRLAAVPFHFYAPDVYQGTNSATAGLLAVLPKIAAVAALARLMPTLSLAAGAYAWQAVIVLSILTMTIGNLCALWQTRLRRLMAWSSVAHSGYILIGLAVALAANDSGPAGLGGYSAMWLYLIVYAVASLGVFAALSSLGEAGREPDRLDELTGLSRTRPGVTAALALFLFSLTGLPPMAGFWGKLALISGAAGVASSDQTTTGDAWWFIALAVVAVINTAIGAAYYLRIVALTFFQAEAPPRPARQESAWAATVLCALLALVIGLWPGAAVGPAARAERSLDDPAIHSQPTAGIPSPPSDVPPLEGRRDRPPTSRRR